MGCPRPECKEVHCVPILAVDPAPSVLPRNAGCDWRHGRTFQRRIHPSQQPNGDSGDSCSHCIALRCRSPCKASCWDVCCGLLLLICRRRVFFWPQGNTPNKRQASNGLERVEESNDVSDCFRNKPRLQTAGCSPRLNVNSSQQWVSMLLQFTGAWCVQGDIGSKCANGHVCCRLHFADSSHDLPSPVALLFLASSCLSMFRRARFGSWGMADDSWLTIQGEMWGFVWFSIEVPFVEDKVLEVAFLHT